MNLHEGVFSKRETTSRANVNGTSIHYIISKFKMSVKFTTLREAIAQEQPVPAMTMCYEGRSDNLQQLPAIRLDLL